MNTGTQRTSLLTPALDLRVHAPQHRSQAMPIPRRSRLTPRHPHQPPAQVTLPGLHLAEIASPLGTLLAAAAGESVLWLTFADDSNLETGRAEVENRFGLPVLPGDSPVLKRLRKELHDYFRGTLRQFRVPCHPRGTPFQCRVWEALQRIPHGQTASYQDVALALGNRAAVRAVGRANAANPLCLLVPCHRVIAKDGTLGGYSAGTWRKAKLLQLERTGRLPEGAPGAPGDPRTSTPDPLESPRTTGGGVDLAPTLPDALLAVTVSPQR